KRRRKARPGVPREVTRNAKRVGCEVEDPPHPVDGLEEASRIAELDTQHEMCSVSAPGDLDQSWFPARFDGPSVAPTGDLFDPRSGARGEEAKRGIPVEGRPVGKAKGQPIAFCPIGRTATGTQPTGRFAETGTQRVVELTNALEPGGEGNLRHREIRFIEQSPRKVKSARPRKGVWRRPQVLEEQAPQLPFSDAETCRELPHAAGVEGAFADEAQAARDDGRGPPPRRCAGRGLRATAQARPEPRVLCGGSAREKAHILALRRRSRADRPAVDPRRRHAGEKATVEAAVAAAQG